MQTQYTSTMTSKGQVTVPVAIRRKLGLKPGQPVQFKMNGKIVKVEPAEDWEANLERLQAKVRAHLQKHNIKPLTDEELDRAINDAGAAEARARYLRSLQ